jgi:hypothetical protein
VAFQKAESELYRSIAVSASLKHLLPIVSVKNGVRKLSVRVKSTLENQIFRRKFKKKNEN